MVIILRVPEVCSVVSVSLTQILNPELSRARIESYSSIFSTSPRIATALYLGSVYL